jgi:ATP-binding cassette, subfamily F, member 3
LTPGKARALLGRFLFSGEEAEKPLEVLSGGERRRLSLAILVASGANVLILDEPTNHLDLESREALEQALGEFQGALLLVSHDRALLDAVGTRTVAFEAPDDAGAARTGEAGSRANPEPASLHSYVGGWPEYLRAREERVRARAAPAKPPPGRKAPPRPKPSRSTTQRDQERLEHEIEAAEAALRDLEDELAHPAAWAGAEAAARSTARHEEAKRAVEDLYERLERIAG